MAVILKPFISGDPMTTLATDPLTLVHLAICLAAIATGLPVLSAMVKGRTPVILTASSWG
jgi:hypothetical protein